MSKVLSIDLDKEYRLRIENKDEIQTSFFKDVYKQAFEQVENIIKWSNDSLKNSGTDTFSREFREYNNIIAFTGERGTGKSSAMLTVANNLDDNNKNGISLGEDIKDTYMFDTHFESLHTIDPSKFEKHQNIIEVILAELFESFDTLIKDPSKQHNESEKREVLKAFQEVYKCLKVVSNTDHTKKYEGDALETLATLADATKLEKNLQDLISRYLKFIHTKNAKESSTLIIPIDDFDLNVKAAGDMAEQIRKYLMIPQVLVLMAINLEQFGDVKTQEVIGDFQTLFTRSNMSESPRDVAARYILKLIPIERRLIIPSLRIERNDVEILLLKGDDVIINRDSKLTFENQIFDYIFKYTGLYFVTNPQEYHVFLPDTLRELNSLFSMLGSFERDPLNKDVNKNEINKYRIKNIEIFYNYFINTWIKDYINTPIVKVILNSNSISYSSWNKYFTRSIVEFLENENGYKKDWLGKDKVFSNNNEIRLIIDKNNYQNNISLGDLIYILQFLNRIYFNDKTVKRIIFAIQTFYSIQLTKFRYDIINNNILYNDKTNNKLQYPLCNLLINEKIRKIVNGTIVNHEVGIVRKTKSSYKSRIQFSVKWDSFMGNLKHKSYNFKMYNDFIFGSIFSRFKYEASYRRNDGFISDKINFDNVRLNQPTINIFSFIINSNDDVFELPFNNLEYWGYLLDSINKENIKEEAEDSDLIIDTYKQICEKIKVEEYLHSLKKNKILRIISLNENELNDLKNVIQAFYDCRVNDDEKNSNKNKTNNKHNVMTFLKRRIKSNTRARKKTIYSNIGDSKENEYQRSIIDNYLLNYKDNDAIEVKMLQDIVTELELF